MGTIRDFINECKNYQYSQEYYDIMKESAELLIMEQFVADQKFNKENTTVFSEGYLTEACSEEQVESINESIKEKAGNLVNKIGTSLNNAIKAIKAFFKKLFKVKDQYAIDDKIVNRIMNHKFDEACVNNISTTIEECKLNMPRVRVNGTLRYNTIDGFTLTPAAKRDVDFAIAMIQKSVLVSCDANCVDIYDLTKELHALVEILKAGEKVSDRMMEDIVHTVDQNRAHANKDGIVIDFSLNNIDDIYKELESYGDVSRMTTTLPNTPLHVYSETIGRVMPTIGDTLAMYSAVLATRLKFKKLFMNCVK